MTARSHLRSPMPGQQHEVTFRFLAQPTDVNFGGKVHGGMAMKWIDQAGYACAVGWSGTYCVTASVGGIQFVAPILIGDLVTVRARLIHTGTQQHASRGRRAGVRSGKDEQRLATSCVMVFVALDAPGRQADAGAALGAARRRTSSRLQAQAQTVAGVVARACSGWWTAPDGCSADRFTMRLKMAEACRDTLDHRAAGVDRHRRDPHNTPSLLEGYPSGQRGQTVNLLAYAFGGSNPPPSTSFDKPSMRTRHGA